MQFNRLYDTLRLTTVEYRGQTVPYAFPTTSGRRRTTSVVQG